MVRPTLYIIAFFGICMASPAGVWITSSGDKITVPCPQNFNTDAPHRLPAGCSASIPLVGYHPEYWQKTQARRAGLLIERAQCIENREEQIQEIVRLENQLSEALERCTEDILGLSCPPCPALSCAIAWAPRLTGAAAGLALCGGLWIGGR